MTAPLDYTSHSGYRSGYVKVTQNKGRTETEEYNFNNAYLNQTHDYVYETDSSGEIYPDNRVVQLKFKRNKSDSTPYETLKYNYDELGRVTHRYLIGQNTSGNYFRDIYSYKARNARNSCNCVYQEGTTNYLSSIQYRCGSVSGTEFVDYDIKTNCNVKIFIGSDDSETRKEFSELCGQKKIKNYSVNTNAENPASSNTGASNQPLITVGMLERLNGDEKGDAIVSVRGYEPIWTRFTPSYELKKIYFKNGKADISKREAVLFNKEEYVFDIDGKGQRIEDKLLDEIEEEDNAESKYQAEREKRLAELDRKWDEVKNEIHKNLTEFVSILTGRDCKRVLELALENKALFLYSIMGDYSQSDALQIRNMADFISKKTTELAELQSSAVK